MSKKIISQNRLLVDVFTVTKRCPTKTGVVEKSVLHFNYPFPAVKK